MHQNGLNSAELSIVPKCEPQYSVGFILMPEFTMTTFANAVSVLRLANRHTNLNHYQWSLLTMDDLPVYSSDGIPTHPNLKLDEKNHFDLLLVCGGYNIHKHINKKFLQKLRAISKTGTALGALCTGSHILAAAGLLDGYRCTIHWENIHGFREEFPNITIVNNLYVIDRDRYTCSSGSSSIDMMINLVAKHLPKPSVQEILAQFGYERVHTDHDLQKTPLSHLAGINQPKLSEVVSLMESNTEEPLSLSEIAQYVGISRRQLERLFHDYLNCTPSRYYMKIRLQRARLLLLQTCIPIVEIAISCGFNTAPHFSKCYSELFGNPPRQERRALLMQ